MRLAILLAACGLAVNGTTYAADTVGRKHLTLPQFEGEELVAIVVDSDVYARSRANYPDVRLLDSATDQEIPYLIRRAQTKRSRKVQQVWHPEDLAVKPLDDGGLEIRFRSDRKRHPRAPQGIRFISPLTNFEHHVRVEVSDDGTEWRTVVDDGLIFDYSQFMDVRNLAIEPLNLGDDQPEFYRLTIADVTQEQQSQLLELTRSLSGEDETNRTERVTINRQPFRIDRIDLWIDEVRDDVVDDKEQEYPLTIDRTEQDAESKATHIYLKSRREPLTEMTVVTPSRNFSRAARVEVRGESAGADTWHSIGTWNLSRIDFRTLKRESLTMSIPNEIRATEYRLTIDNGDNPPLDVTEVTANGHVYEVVFLATSGKQYDLTYGNEKIAAPNYDTAAIAASLQEGFAPLIATLGEESLVEPAVVPESYWKWLVNNTWAMTAIIGVLVLVLAAALYRATRHLENFQDPQ